MSKRILRTTATVIAVLLLAMAFAAPAAAGSGTVTVVLLDSDGKGLDGATVSYYQGGWQPIGETGDNDEGIVSGAVPITTDIELRGPFGSFKWKNVDPLTNPTLTISTIEVTVKLETCDGAPLVGAAQRYYKGWQYIGDTEATVELLPYYDEANTVKNWYDFNVVYDSRTSSTITQYIADDPVVVLKTTKVTFDYSGPIFYYNGGWQSFTNGMEVIGGPGKWADFKFGDTHNPTLRFDIDGCELSGTPALIHFLDSAGNGVAGVPASHRSSGGGYDIPIGTTDANGKIQALLPNYVTKVSMDWDDRRETKDLGPMPLVFQTVNAEVRFETCAGGMGHSGVDITFKPKSNFWNFGTTDANGLATREVFAGIFDLQIPNFNWARSAVIEDHAFPGLATFQTTKVALNYLNTIQYKGPGYSGAWRAYSNPMELLPGDYTFRFKTGPGNNDWSDGIPVTVEGCALEGNVFIFKTIDSNGDPLPDIPIYRNDYGNHYVSVGTTDADGLLFTTDQPSGTWKFRASLEHTNQYVTSGPGLLTFQTSKFVVHVKHTAGSDYPGINAYYNDYGNHYLSMGVTDGIGNATIELFPGDYRFKASKDHTEQTGNLEVVTSGDSETIDFQTATFVVHVKKSDGTDYPSIAASFNDYGNHYLSMGDTDAYGKVSIELFPGNYKFRAYKDHTDQTGFLNVAASGTTGTIDFQTADFIVHVKDSDYNNYPGIAASFNDYGNHYLSMGNTDGDGNASIELFPGTHTFKAYKDHTEDTGDLTIAGPGGSGVVEFQTAKAIGLVKDCDGTPLPGFKVTFNDYGNHWLNMGTTGNDGKASIELFPGTRTIRAWIDYTYEVKDLDLNLTESTVEFNPTKVDFVFGGTVKYNDYGNHWKTMTSPFYLFPGTYDFMFDGEQKTLSISGCYLTGGFLTLVDEVGNPLVNYPSDYPGETRNLQWKNRCGGSWASSTSFQTDVNGQTFYNIGCTNWDKKITMTLNQTSLEQDVIVNSTFQTAKVNVNLKDHLGNLIAEVPGGTVRQGGGYWYTHGTTGPGGQVIFYAFPGNIKLEMSYNYGSETRDSVAIVAGINDIDYQTGLVNIWFSGTVQIQTGSWNDYTGPLEMLPVQHKFWFSGPGHPKAGPLLVTPVPGTVYEKTVGYIRLLNSDGTPQPNYTASWYRYGAGSAPGVPIAETPDANGVLLNPMDGYNNTYYAYYFVQYLNSETYPPGMYQIPASNSFYDFQLTRIEVQLKDHEGNLITGTGPDVYFYTYKSGPGGQMLLGQLNNGTISLDVLQGYRHYFDIYDYNGTYQQVWQDDLSTPVVFQTFLADDNTWGCTGYSQYPQADYGKPFPPSGQVELLPGHRIYYKNSLGATQWFDVLVGGKTLDLLNGTIAP